MIIVKCRNPKNGVVYVYTHERYFDEEQNKYRTRRKCIGQVDPETGETIPNKPRGRVPGTKIKKSQDQSESPSKDYQAIAKQLEDAKMRIVELEEKLEREQRKLSASQKKLERIMKIMSED